MAQDDTLQCPEALLTQALAEAGGDDARGLARVEALVADYPADARLHFLRGSLLAAQRRYDEAREAMQGAVAIAPGYAIARYQLGFLQFTSGDAVGAMATWGPLHSLPDDHYLRLFATGLTHLAGDEFAPALAALQQGMAANAENPAMNGDIQLLVGEVEKLAAGGTADGGGTAPATTEAAAEDEPTSAAHMLLQQHAAKPTRH